MGYFEDVSKKTIQDTALKVIENCANKSKYNKDDAKTNLILANTAKIWCDIYQALKKQEVEL